MDLESKLIRLLAAQSSSRGQTLHVCHSCRVALSLPFSQSLRLASTAAARATQDTPPITQLSPSGPGASPAPQPLFTIKAGIVVSRPPLITPDPHPFETAYHLYQRRLNERLALPFSQYFYYKKNTPAVEQWRANRRARGGAAARDIGNYNAYTPEAWNDEILVGDETAQPAKIVEQLIAEEGRSEEFTGSGDPRYAGLKRKTEADEKNDQKSLERSLTRTLYLLVKTTGDGGSWKFPAGTLAETEGLKEVRRNLRV
jgi:large subunit ribosomal protein L46